MPDLGAWPALFYRALQSAMIRQSPDAHGSKSQCAVMAVGSSVAGVEGTWQLTYEEFQVISLLRPDFPIK